MTLDAKALEIAAKRLCMEAMGGDGERNHSRIALSWGVRGDQYRAEAQAAITAYLAAIGNGWRPIETAPRDDGRRLLLWVEPVEEAVAIAPDGNCVVIGEYVRWSEGMRGRGFKDGWSWYGAAQCKPTHWRPLPAAPERTPAPELQT